MKRGSRFGWELVMIASVGCGPQVAPAGDASTSAADSATTPVDPSLTTNDVPASPSSSTSSMPGDDTGSSSSSSTTGDGAESSSTGPFECGCPDDTPIDFDTELREGFMPAEALARFQAVATPLRWTAYEGMPETVLHIDAAYVGGAVGEGPGGEDGCLFLSMPCRTGVSMEVELTLVTDDGALAWTLPAELIGDPAGYVQVGFDLQDIGGNEGTLASWPLQVRGRPFVVAEVSVSLSRFDDILDDIDATVSGWSSDGVVTMLGEAL